MTPDRATLQPSLHATTHDLSPDGTPSDTRMFAATARRYGPPSVMALESLPRPTPGPGQVLVAVEAFGVTRGDARIRGLDVPLGFGLMVRAIFGFTRPRQPIFGREFAGHIAALGAGVTDWQVGTPVFGITDGMSMGAGAEYCVLGAKKALFRRPDTMSAEQGATLLFGGMTALDFLTRQMSVKPGETLLINGATGAVGSAMTQIAKSLGLTVTVVCSAQNAGLARDLGADTVFDYRAPGGIVPPTGGFDVIADIVGTLPYAKVRPLLADGGRLCVITGSLAQTIGGILRPRRGPHRIASQTVQEAPEHALELLRLFAAGQYAPAIGARLPMSEIVTAHELASGGHKRGNVVVTF